MLFYAEESALGKNDSHPAALLSVCLEQSLLTITLELRASAVSLSKV